MEVNNTTSLQILTIIIISVINGEEIERIIVNRDEKITINECFNEFIRKYFNDRLCDSNILIKMHNIII